MSEFRSETTLKIQTPDPYLRWEHIYGNRYKNMFRVTPPPAGYRAMPIIGTRLACVEQVDPHPDHTQESQ
ncbi:hypothetical protein D3OALGA1CA_4363 [Olavius algarvensis associated proteobacterium Delta 3]|nr:hypothetical protein D3OALGB2SA_175 [Olavius algarvensis associated proteobacterium Delta 3]CAB5149921.1 hypothetical protein D3OALGA1CA_4363 [Olavius algarvensis associated proteobacterium Delta 3]